MNKQEDVVTSVVKNYIQLVVMKQVEVARVLKDAIIATEQELHNRR